MTDWLVYTDGSCKSGEAGGFGFVVKPPNGPPIEGHGSEHPTLAKVMEMRAVAEALAVVEEGARVTVFADNQSLVESLNVRLGDWTKSGFKNVDAAVAPWVRRVADAIAARRLTVRFQWVRAHNGNAGNERADALAAQGAREAKARLTSSRR